MPDPSNQGMAGPSSEVGYLFCATEDALLPDIEKEEAEVSEKDKDGEAGSLFAVRLSITRTKRARLNDAS